MKPASETDLLSLVKRHNAYAAALDLIRRGVWGASGYDRVLRLLADLRFPADPESTKSTLDGQTRWTSADERAAVELLRKGLGYPATGLDAEPVDPMPYVGDALPKWVAAGVRLKVKSTPHLRKYGLQIRSGNEQAYPGDVGTVERSEGNGWWDWRIVFPRYGGSYRLDQGLLEKLTRVK